MPATFLEDVMTTSWQERLLQEVSVSGITEVVRLLEVYRDPIEALSEPDREHLLSEITDRRFIQKGL
jgi:hypothetical protein